MYQYTKQQKFNRIKNLSSIWENFTNKDEITDLFLMLDNIEQSDKNDNNKIEKLQSYSAKSKHRFLAMLEEVVVYASIGQIDRTFALEYFQWHFYFVYESSKTSDAFWTNIGGTT